MHLKHLFIWLCQVVVAACGIEFPDKGSDVDPLPWELGVLATGPPEKCQECILESSL